MHGKIFVVDFLEVLCMETPSTHEILRLLVILIYLVTQQYEMSNIQLTTEHCLKAKKYPIDTCTHLVPMDEIY